MRTIEGVEYVSMTDLAELWGLEHVYTIRNRIYAEIRHGNRFPEADIRKRTVGAEVGQWGGSTPSLWRADRLPELTAWWERYGQGRGKAPVAEVAPRVEPTVVFQGVDIVLTVAENFPAFRDSHVLAVIKRHGEGTKTEHYFITREEAGYILSLFA